jgi:uncharacterized membrane protein
MQNIAIILALLLLPYWVLTFAHVSESLRGRIGVALVFAFTGLGHFVKTSAMSQMLPPWVPMRIPLIYVTGVFEFLGAIAILIPPVSKYTAIALCVFLFLVLPSNIYAAFKRIDFGGHDAGPVYLLVRIPLQLFLIGWFTGLGSGRSRDLGGSSKFQAPTSREAPITKLQTEHAAIRPHVAETKSTDAEVS